MASIEEELARLKLQNSQLEDEVQRMRKEGCETPKEINEYLKSRAAFQLDDVDSPDSPHVISGSREGSTGGQWIKPLGVRPAAPSMAESTLNEMEAAISSLRAWREQRQQELNSMQRQNEAFLEELYAKPPDEVDEEEDLDVGRDEDASDGPGHTASAVSSTSEEQRVLDELESLAKQWRTTLAISGTSGGSSTLSQGSHAAHASGPSNILSQRVMDLLKQAERMTFMPPPTGSARLGRGAPFSGGQAQADPPASRSATTSPAIASASGQQREAMPASKATVPAGGITGDDDDDGDGVPAAMIPGKTDWSAYMKELEKQQQLEEADELINWSSDLVGGCGGSADVLGWELEFPVFGLGNYIVRQDSVLALAGPVGQLGWPSCDSRPCCAAAGIYNYDCVAGWHISG
eukprot:jgi/Mesvir1/19016/Mv12784-RA.1